MASRTIDAGDTALDVARDSEPSVSDAPGDHDQTGIRAGTAVTMTPDDVGRDPVEGVLVGADDREVVIRRADPRVGTLHVHFPRAGYDPLPV